MDMHTDLAADTSEATVAEAKKVRRVIAGTALTISDATGVCTYDVTHLPSLSATLLQLVGLRYLMTVSGDKDARWQQLVNGTYALPTGPGKKQISSWRLAIAHALVEDTANSANPFTFDAAKAKAFAIPKNKLLRAKNHPLIVKHHARLTGSAPASVTSLF